MIVHGNETVLVQGITGKQATFWSQRMKEYGTKVVGGVNPKKAGIEHLGLPVWGSATDAAKDQDAAIDCSCVIVPPPGVKSSVLDALEAGIKKIVILTEHIPVHDVMYFLSAAREAGASVIGPNTAGIVTPGECFVGFMPAFNERGFKPGAIGGIPRSGSLGTIVCSDMVQAGFGISAFIGIGGDPVIGTTTRAALQCLDENDKTTGIALIGEIGGGMEEDAAEYAATMKKPIVSFMAGAASPPGKKMGHAGAIVMGDKGSYAGKKRAFEEAGVTVLPTPSMLPDALRERLAG